MLLSPGAGTSKHPGVKMFWKSGSLRLKNICVAPSQLFSNWDLFVRIFVLVHHILCPWWWVCLNVDEDVTYSPPLHQLTHILTVIKKLRGIIQKLLWTLKVEDFKAKCTFNLKIAFLCHARCKVEAKHAIDMNREQFVVALSLFGQGTELHFCFLGLMSNSRA